MGSKLALGLRVQVSFGNRDPSHKGYKMRYLHTPPIVGDDVYVCIESLKYYDKIYDILLWRKKSTFIVFKFSSQSFKMLCNGSFQGFEDSKNNGMNGLIGYLESIYSEIWTQPAYVMLMIFIFWWYSQ